MEIYKILLEILNKPEAPKFYRELSNYYEKNKKIQEASAIKYLLEQKFKKNESPNSSNISEKQ
jgi:hypothetical protein